MCDCILCANSYRLIGIPQQRQHNTTQNNTERRNSTKRTDINWITLIQYQTLKRVCVFFFRFSIHWSVSAIISFQSNWPLLEFGIWLQQKQIVWRTQMKCSIDISKSLDVCIDLMSFFLLLIFLAKWRKWNDRNKSRTSQIWCLTFQIYQHLWMIQVVWFYNRIRNGMCLAYQ